MRHRNHKFSPWPRATPMWLRTENWCFISFITSELESHSCWNKVSFFPCKPFTTFSGRNDDVQMMQITSMCTSASPQCRKKAQCLLLTIWDSFGFQMHSFSDGECLPRCLQTSSFQVLSCTSLAGFCNTKQVLLGMQSVPEPPPQNYTS